MILVNEVHGNKKIFFGYVGQCVGVLKNEDKEKFKVSFFFSFLFTVRVCSQVPWSLCLEIDPGRMKHYPGYKEID